MKRLIASLVAVVSMNSVGFAGGNIILGEIKNLELNGFYIGGALHAVSVRDADAVRNYFDIKPQQDRIGNGSIILGYEFFEYLDIEGRYGQTFQDEDCFTMDYSWSVFLKPKFKIEDREDIIEGNNFFTVYGLLGYGKFDLLGIENYEEVGYLGGKHSGFQWGVGVSYTLRDYSDLPGYKYEDTWSIFADYTSYANDMDAICEYGPAKMDLDSINVGVVYNFFSLYE